TALLQACTLDAEDRPVAAERLMRLPLGGRLAALLALAGAADGEPLAALMRCPACDEPLGALLPIAARIAYRAAAGGARLEVRLGDRRLGLGLPTAEDVERWQDDAGVERMVRELVASDEPLPDPLPAEWVSAIEQVLGEADPLVDFRVNT